MSEKNNFEIYDPNKQKTPDKRPGFTGPSGGYAIEASAGDGGGGSPFGSHSPSAKSVSCIVTFEDVIKKEWQSEMAVDFINKLAERGVNVYVCFDETKSTEKDVAASGIELGGLIKGVSYKPEDKEEFLTDMIKTNDKSVLVTADKKFIENVVMPLRDVDKQVKSVLHEANKGKMLSTLQSLSLNIQYLDQTINPPPLPHSDKLDKLFGKEGGLFEISPTHYNPSKDDGFRRSIPKSDLDYALKNADIQSAKINAGLVSNREAAVAAYVFAEKAHDQWREGKRREDGTFEPTWRGVNGENELRNVTPEMAVGKGLSKDSVVDIANTSFSELPAHWQKDNLAAGEFAAKYYCAIKENPDLLNDKEWMHNAASAIHDAWSKRNSWNDLAKVSFDNLPPEEQEKDVAHLKVMAEIVNNFKSGEYNLEELESKYHINGGEIEKSKEVTG